LELIETCLLDSSLMPFLQAAGYSNYLLEGRERLTIELYDSEKLRHQNSSGFLLFVKPMSQNAFRKALMDSKVNAISLDDTNVRLVRREILNLLRIHRKPLEILLNSSSSLTISNSIGWGRKWIDTMFFSSCATTISEIWSPLVKMNYLVVHGATEVEALSWVFHSPRRFILLAHSNTS